MKTKNKFKFLTLFFFLLTITACSLDTDLTSYMDETKEKELAKSTDKNRNKIIQAKINGSYDLLINKAFSTSHDYFGLKSVLLATDMWSEDLVQENPNNFFGFDYNIDNYGETYRRTVTTWRLFYAIINNCNKVLEEYFPEESYDDKAINATISEIISMRAICYYYLVNIYQHSYDGNEDAPGVPIVLSTKDINKPRARVKELYEKAILKDLEFAMEHGIVTEKKKDTDKAVAAAYAAKAYAAMKKWDDVIRSAKIAIKEAQINAPSKTWSVGNSGWLWGAPINGQSSTMYASFYSHMDSSIPGGYASKGAKKNIYNALYDKIKDTDVRKKFFVNKEKFPDDFNDSKLRKYNSIKYTSKSDFTTDYCFLRAEDSYLLMIEAYVEKGDLAAAKDLLKEFMSRRDSEYDVDAFTSQEELREEVRLQRRIELWAEGSSYFDFKRWKKGVNRKPGITNNAGVEIEPTNHPTVLDLAAESETLILQIPKTEFENNPNIGEQNPLPAKKN